MFTPAPDENLAGVNVALQSYDYQACEDPQYDESRAAKFVNDLSQAIQSKLHMNEDQLWAAGKEYAHGDKDYWSVAEWPNLINI